MSENINLQTVQETMLISLWGRAKFSRLYPELLDDPKAAEIIKKVDAMAKRFPGGEIIFDAASKLGVKMANRMVKKTGNKGAPMYFGLDNPVRQISKWSDRIKGVEWYSFWHDVPRNPRWSKQTIWKMNGCDLFRMGKYVQVRFL